MHVAWHQLQLESHQLGVHAHVPGVSNKLMQLTAPCRVLLASCLAKVALHRFGLFASVCGGWPPSSHSHVVCVRSSSTLTAVRSTACLIQDCPTPATIACVACSCPCLHYQHQTHPYCVATPAVDPMYQYTLPWFVSLYCQSIDNSPKPSAGGVPARLIAIEDHFLYSLYCNVCRCAYARGDVHVVCRGR